MIQMDEVKTILGTGEDGSTITGETEYSLLHVSVAMQTAFILGVIAAAEVGFIVLSWYIYQVRRLDRENLESKAEPLCVDKDFGWEIYKGTQFGPNDLENKLSGCLSSIDLGADLAIKRYYLHHQIFVCSIRFAAFFFLGFGVQFIFLVLPQTDPEYYITIGALPVSILLLLLGAFAAQYENLWAMVCTCALAFGTRLLVDLRLQGGFLVGMVGGLGYFVFKTYRIYNQRAMYHKVYKVRLNRNSTADRN